MFSILIFYIFFYLLSVLEIRQHFVTSFYGFCLLILVSFNVAFFVLFLLCSSFMFFISWSFFVVCHPAIFPHGLFLLGNLIIFFFYYPLSISAAHFHPPPHHPFPFSYSRSSSYSCSCSFISFCSWSFSSSSSFSLSYTLFSFFSPCFSFYPAHASVSAPPPAPTSALLLASFSPPRLASLNSRRIRYSNHGSDVPMFSVHFDCLQGP